MAPPPATPAASRFVLPKRRLAEEQKAESSPFRATPRFAPSSSSQATVHRLPPFSTPGPTVSRTRHVSGRATQDSIDSSPPSPENVRAGPQDEDDSVDGFGADLRASSESPSRGNEPLAKRRRLSISPELGGSPIEVAGTGEAEQVDEDDSQDLHEDLEAQSDRGSEESRVDESNTMDESEQLANMRNLKGPKQPAFLRPPQFKAPDEVENRPQPHPLPDAFSPRRHGAKYLPGGLAGELRDWLMGLNGGDEGERLGASEVRIVVDDVRSGPNMWIVRGHHEVMMPDKTFNLMLAGVGRVTGLAKPNIVRGGSLVVVAPPTWEVSLDGLGAWVVACNWFTEAATAVL